LLLINAPQNERTTTVYDSAEMVIATIDPLGRRTTTVYDENDQVVATINPLWLRTTTVYDDNGWGGGRRAFTMRRAR
jgi:trimeric autotransporter adhesin